MNMGDRIRICLKQQKMNMKELSEKADMPLSTLSDLMNGKTKKLDVQKAKEISNILQCSLDYLIDADLMDDIGYELETERESKGYTLEELSEETKIPVENLKEFEESTQRINFFLLEKICAAYDISVNQFYVDTELYTDYIPAHFEGDVDRYEAFKIARDNDALEESYAHDLAESIIQNLEFLPIDKLLELKNITDAKFTIVTNEEEQNHIKKYRTLDERGKQTIDMVLDSQYELIIAKTETSATEGAIDEDIEKELESYRQELLAEQKGKTLSVSPNTKGA